MKAHKIVSLTAKDAAIAFLNDEIDSICMAGFKYVKVSEISFSTTGLYDQVTIWAGGSSTTIDTTALISAKLKKGIEKADSPNGMSEQDRNRSMLIRIACRMLDTAGDGGSPTLLTTPELIARIARSVDELNTTIATLEKKIDADQADMDAAGRVLARILTPSETH